jgi:rhamnosyltransferase
VESVESCVYVVVPTLNASLDWAKFAPALMEGIAPQRVLIVDSSSGDGTPELARAAGFAIQSIQGSDFNHGGTRQAAVELLSDADIVVFLTQDAVLADPGAISSLIKAFDDPTVGIAFGRQLPRLNAKPIEAHARLFNYGSQSDTRTIADRDRLGFKSIFVSNSFAAYRKTALLAVGGFPTNVIFGEDTVVAARFLLSGWKIAYVAEAKVYHSHSYTMGQEFKRYFDIGVLHQREGWLRREFGGASSEGMRFVRSELSFLWSNSKRLIPSALLRSVLKWVGYQLGRREDKLNLRWKKRFSMHAGFWV